MTEEYKNWDYPSSRYYQYIDPRYPDYCGDKLAVEVAADLALLAYAPWEFIADESGICSGSIAIIPGDEGFILRVNSRTHADFTIVSIAGTRIHEGFEYAARDFAADAEIERVTFPYPGSSTVVHKGFYDRFRSIWADIEPIVSQRPTAYIGHSLGGAVAKLCAFQGWLDKHKVIALYTFGQPKTGDKNLGVIDKEFPHVRVVHGYDAIPHIPDESPFCHTIEPLHILETGKQVSGHGLHALLNKASRLLWDARDLLADHPMLRYCQALKQARRRRL